MTINLSREKISEGGGWPDVGSCGVRGGGCRRVLFARADGGEGEERKAIDDCLER